MAPPSRRRRRPRSSLLAATLLGAQLRGTAAWDKEGHEAVGMTAMSALQPEPVSQVKHLMHGRDAVDVAAWAHKVNKKYPWSVDLHFQPQPSTSCQGADLSICPDNRCIIGALKHFYGRLVGTPMGDLDWHGLKLTDADAVKYLINLIGDLHQPLHLAWIGDNMGRNTTVTYNGKRSTLFDLWDKELAQAVIQESPGFWWGGWTHVQRTHVEYEQDSARWKKDGVLMFERWANETAKYTCEHVYASPVMGSDLAEVIKSGGPVRIDDHVFQGWKRDMLSRILVAGARVAIVLNSVLQHRQAGELHAGTAVTGVEDGDEDQERGGPPKVGSKGDEMHLHHRKVIKGKEAAAINFSIFVVVGAIFLVLMRFWDQGKKQANLEKQQGTGKKI